MFRYEFHKSFVTKRIRNRRRSIFCNTSILWFRFFIIIYNFSIITTIIFTIILHFTIFNFRFNFVHYKSMCLVAYNNIIFHIFNCLKTIFFKQLVIIVSSKFYFIYRLVISRAYGDNGGGSVRVRERRKNFILF